MFFLIFGFPHYKITHNRNIHEHTTFCDNLFVENDLLGYVRPGSHMCTVQTPGVRTHVGMSRHCCPSIYYTYHPTFTRPLMSVINLNLNKTVLHLNLLSLFSLWNREVKFSYYNYFFFFCAEEYKYCIY